MLTTKVYNAVENNLFIVRNTAEDRNSKEFKIVRN